MAVYGMDSITRFLGMRLTTEYGRLATTTAYLSFAVVTLFTMYVASS